MTLVYYLSGSRKVFLCNVPYPSRPSSGSPSTHTLPARSTPRMVASTLIRFLNNYGYDKGPITASAIVDDLLDIIEQYYVYHDSSFLMQGQMVRSRRDPADTPFLLTSILRKVSPWLKPNSNLSSSTSSTTPISKPSKNYRTLGTWPKTLLQEKLHRVTRRESPSSTEKRFILGVSLCVFPRSIILYGYAGCRFAASVKLCVTFFKATFRPGL